MQAYKNICKHRSINTDLKHRSINIDLQTQIYKQRNAVNWKAKEAEQSLTFKVAPTQKEYMCRPVYSADLQNQTAGGRCIGVATPLGGTATTCRVTDPLAPVTPAQNILPPVIQLLGRNPVWLIIKLS